MSFIIASLIKACQINDEHGDEVQVDYTIHKPARHMLVGNELWIELHLDTDLVKLDLFIWKSKIKVEAIGPDGQRFNHEYELDPYTWMLVEDPKTSGFCVLEELYSRLVSHWRDVDWSDQRIYKIDGNSLVFEFECSSDRLPYFQREGFDVVEKGTLSFVEVNGRLEERLHVEISTPNEWPKYVNSYFECFVALFWLRFPQLMEDEHRVCQGCVGCYINKARDLWKIPDIPDDPFMQALPAKTPNVEK